MPAATAAIARISRQIHPVQRHRLQRQAARAAPATRLALHRCRAHDPHCLRRNFWHGHHPHPHLATRATVHRPALSGHIRLLSRSTPRRRPHPSIDGPSSHQGNRLPLLAWSPHACHVCKHICANYQLLGRSSSTNTRQTRNAGTTPIATSCGKVNRSAETPPVASRRQSVERRKV